MLSRKAFSRVPFTKWLLATFSWFLLISATGFSLSAGYNYGGGTVEVGLVADYTFALTGFYSSSEDETFAGGTLKYWTSAVPGEEGKEVLFSAPYVEAGFGIRRKERNIVIPGKSRYEYDTEFLVGAGYEQFVSPNLSFSAGIYARFSSTYGGESFLRISVNYYAF